MKQIIELAKQYPNDQQLGELVRKISNLSKYLPNDQELGQYVRKITSNYICKQY